MLNSTIQLSGKYTNSVQIRTNFQVDRKGYLDFYFIPETLLNTRVAGNIAISDQQKAPNAVKISSPLLSEEAGWHSSRYRDCLQNNQTKAAPCEGALLRNRQHFYSKTLILLPEEMNRLFGRYFFILNVLVEQYLICSFLPCIYVFICFSDQSRDVLTQESSYHVRQQLVGSFCCAKDSQVLFLLQRIPLISMVQASCSLLRALYNKRVMLNKVKCGGSALHCITSMTMFL